MLRQNKLLVKFWEDACGHGTAVLTDELRSYDMGPRPLPPNNLPSIRTSAQTDTNYCIALL